jgi:CTP-dependent riboflavin kinase
MQVIQGRVRSGAGTAAPAFREPRNREIREAFGWTPYPGTLNVTLPSPRDLTAAVASLGEPILLTEHGTKIGPLRWWRVTLECLPALSMDVLVVRGLKSRAPYLELVAPVRLRDLGIADGDPVTLIPVPR